jgi:hypothetical protein
MTGLLEPHAIGEALTRRDGERKVRGTANETPVERPAYAHIVQAAVARGRITGVDTSAARGLDGVLAVLTAASAERLASAGDRELAVLQSAEVDFRGQRDRHRRHRRGRGQRRPPRHRRPGARPPRHSRQTAGRPTMTRWMIQPAAARRAHGSR